MSEKINGPFGSYDWGSPGALLNSLVRSERVPLNRAEHLQIKDSGEIYEGKTRLAFYKWFEGISTPCLHWVDPSAHSYAEAPGVSKNGVIVPKFKPSLCVHGTPALEVSDNWATPALHYFLRGMLTNYTDDERYKLHQAAGAFFQGGHNDPNGKWFLVEFWKPEGVETFIQYINEHYDPTDEMYKEFL